MTASAGPVLERLHEEFGDKVAFLTLYVREAHPGEHYPQPATFDQKLEHARAYERRDDIPWPFVVDDPDGSLHRSLDPKPSAAYLVDSHGLVVSRVLWSNHDRPLRDGLEAVVAGVPLPQPDREPRLVPMLAGLGRMHEILSLAGREARRDVMREAPPMYGIARLAGAFRPLPPVARSIAAMALAAGTALLVVGGLRRAVRAA